MTLALLLACSSDSPLDPVGGPSTPSTPAPSTPATPAVVARDPVALLARLSLDVRGVRPTPGEIARVEADPAELEVLVEEFLADPRFEGRLLELFNELLLTRSSTPTYIFDYAVLPDYDAFSQSVGEEPVRFLTWLALEDRDWDEVLTSDVTLVDHHLASSFPTDYPNGETGWKPAHYTDGRPNVGLLATNGMWWRYPSTDSNKQRKRANQVSRILVCTDYLLTEVQFDANVDLTDEEALNDAIATNEGCKACHDTLDPLASYFWGWRTYYGDGLFLAGASSYHPESERDWVEETGVAPGWQGQPGDTLLDLSAQIRNDPRFDACIVQQVFEHLMRRPAMLDDAEPMAAHQAAFGEGGRTIRSVYRSVLQDERYRSGDTDAADAVPKKWLTADQVRTAVFDLTGFVWSSGGVDLLADDTIGLLTLAGGVDGKTSTVPATAPSSTGVLVVDRYATAAAMFAVGAEAELAPAERRLFAAVELDSADEASLVPGLTHLFLVVLSRRVAPDGPEIEATSDLWREVAATDGPRSAWGAVLGALLRDPDFTIY